MERNPSLPQEQEKIDYNSMSKEELIEFIKMQQNEFQEAAQGILDGATEVFTLGATDYETSSYEQSLEQISNSTPEATDNPETNEILVVEDRTERALGLYAFLLESEGDGFSIYTKSALEVHADPEDLEKAA